MKTHRKTAIIVGVLFIIGTVTGFLSLFVFTEPILDDPNYLINVSAYKNQIIIGALLVLIMAFALAMVPVMMFPIFKIHNEALALGYVVFRVLEAVTDIAIVISWLLLLPLSQEYVKAGDPDASYFQTLGAVFQAVRYWATQMIYILNGLAGLMLCYLLYQSKLIPRFISVLGLIGYAVLLPGASLDMLGHVDTLHGAGMIIFLPGSIFEILLLPIWLFVKGFNSSAIASESVKQK